MGASVVKVLVANRGEIACRVIAALREEGLASIAIASEADRRARHVRLADEAVVIGPAPASESYLAIETIVRVARERGAWGIHPGYGFLAENARFAEAVERAGIVFVGPKPQTLALLGDKRAARALAVRAGAPIVPGWEGSAADRKGAARAAAELGYPVLVKAAWGGGGKGMTKAQDTMELGGALESASRVAASAFGDDAVYLEKWIDGARHVEVQILGDGDGGVVHLFERECTLQRRHQKVFEESPSPSLDDATRARLTETAVAIGREAKYRSAGTCEFILDERGRFSFLEVNARIQVEHPVTELVTGCDLVREQLRLALGGGLPFAQEKIQARGVAVEARVYAEDPERGFLPQSGELARVDWPSAPGVRVDAGVDSGDVVSPHYDPLLAKVVAHAPTRAEAWARLAHALDTAVVHGPRVNLDFLRDLARHPDLLAARFTTRSLEDALLPEWLAARASDGAHASLFEAAAKLIAPKLGARAAATGDAGRAVGPFESLAGWRHPGLERGVS